MIRVTHALLFNFPSQLAQKNLPVLRKLRLIVLQSNEISVYYTLTLKNIKYIYRAEIKSFEKIWSFLGQKGSS